MFFADKERAVAIISEHARRMLVILNKINLNFLKENPRLENNLICLNLFLELVLERIKSNLSPEDIGSEITKLQKKWDAGAINDFEAWVHKVGNVFRKTDNLDIALSSFRNFFSFVSDDFFFRFRDMRRRWRFMPKLAHSIRELSAQLHIFEQVVIAPMERLIEIMNRLSQELRAEKIDIMRISEVLMNYSNRDFSSALSQLRKNHTRGKKVLERLDAYDKKLAEYFFVENLGATGYSSLLMPESIRSSVEDKVEKIKQKVFFITEFKRAYESDDQLGIYAVCRKYGTVKNGQLYVGGYKVLGCGINKLAMPGVVNRPKGEHFSWSRDPYSQLKPAYYAGRFKKIIQQGYRASPRYLLVSFEGIKGISNVYFYMVPHLGYGGVHALIVFNIRDFCVFEANGESIIFTPKGISPDKIQLWVRDPSISGEDRQYQIQLIQELKKRDIPFKIKNYWHGSFQDNAQEIA